MYTYNVSYTKNRQDISRDVDMQSTLNTPKFSKIVRVAERSIGGCTAILNERTEEKTTTNILSEKNIPVFRYTLLLNIHVQYLYSQAICGYA